MNRVPVAWNALGLIVAALLGVQLAGCSLFVMGQKMLFGDPVQKAEFTTFTHVDLTKGKHRLMIVCSAPSAVDTDLSTLKLDVIDGVTRRLKREGVAVVDPDKVATWLDDHGGMPADPGQLVQGKDFRDVDYIAWIEIESFQVHEDHSSDLLRGKARGLLHVYRVSELDGQRLTSAVFTKEFTTVYPPHAPISAVTLSPEIFRRAFTHRLPDQLAHKFYDHQAGWDI